MATEFFQKGYSRLALTFSEYKKHNRPVFNKESQSGIEFLSKNNDDIEQLEFQNSHQNLRGYNNNQLDVASYTKTSRGTSIIGYSHQKRSEMASRNSGKKVKSKNNKLNMDMYYCRGFMLNLKNLLPILKVMAKGSTVIQQILDFFVLNNLDQEFSDCFPIRFQIPLGYSFKGKIEFSNFEFAKSINDSDFEIDEKLFFLPQ